MSQDDNSTEYVIYNGKRMTRESAEAKQRYQKETHYTVDGKTYARIPYGRETFHDPVEADFQLCRHCDCAKGQLHAPLCDWEQCPCCGQQVATCDCVIEGHQWTEDD